MSHEPWYNQRVHCARGCRYILTSVVLIFPLFLAAALAKPIWDFACANVQLPVQLHEELKAALHRFFHSGQTRGAVARRGPLGSLRWAQVRAL